MLAMDNAHVKSLGKGNLLIILLNLKFDNFCTIKLQFCLSLIIFSDKIPCQTLTLFTLEKLLLELLFG